MIDGETVTEDLGGKSVSGMISMLAYHVSGKLGGHRCSLISRAHQTG